MAHDSTVALLQECDAETAKAIAGFGGAQRSYLSALGNLAQHLAGLQQRTDEAEDDETHPGCLQRIEGIERQAHAVQQHSDKARAAIRTMRGAVSQLEVSIEEFRTEVTDPTPQPGDEG